MGQYKIGTCNFTNGSQTVTGNGTEWLANASIGNVIKKSGENATYQIGAVVSDEEITLTANYAGPTSTYSDYQIVVDFTTNFGLTEIWVGDKDWPYHLTQTIREIDRVMQWMVDRLQSSATTTTTTTTSSSTTTTTTSP